MITIADWIANLLVLGISLFLIGFSTIVLLVIFGGIYKEVMKRE
tara:strand:- start:266 stop:397 length:132 start_codon:yes stop_codon:yes gene_type:complete